MRNAADLDARPVVLQRVLQTALDGAVVAVLLHVDEIDDDEAGEVAQAQLPRHLVGGLEVGAERGVLDVVLARRAPRVHVDGDERLGLVDDEVAARFQRHGVGEHRVELGFDAALDEERAGLAPLPHVLLVARHQHAHVVARLGEAGVAGDGDLVDFLAVKVADGALDQRALLVNEAGRRRFQREFAHAFPHAHEIFEIALDLAGRARGARRAQDDAHALGNFKLGSYFLQAPAVLRVGDLARNAAAARRVRHQDGIAAGERQVGCQRGALAAALLLDDLHQQHLAALDDFLNFVLPARTRRAAGQLLQSVGAADVLDDLFLGFLVVVLVVVDAAGFGSGIRGMDFANVRLGRVPARRVFFDVGLGGLAFGNFGLGLAARLFDAMLLALVARGGLNGVAGLVTMFFRRRLAIVVAMVFGGFGRVFVNGGGRFMFMMLGDRALDGVIMVVAGVMLRVAVIVVRGFHAGLVFRVFPRLAVFTRGYRRAFGVFVVNGNRAGVTGHRFVGPAAALEALRAPASSAALLSAAAAIAVCARSPAFLVLLLRLGAGLVLKQRLSVGDRNLIIVGVNFREGEEAVAIAAVFDERGLERRLHARHFRQIDVAAELPFAGRFEIEFLDPVTA